MADVVTETERVWLDEQSWVDVARGWLPDADDVFAAVLERAAWHQGRLWRYERWVEEPRLGASARDLAGLHPALLDAHRAVHRQYRVDFDKPALAQYRDGRDSVAFHRDREMRWLEDTVIAVLTLGAQRPWLLRPRSRRYDHDAPNRGATHDIAPASGDLLVMGGRCQADWEHSVPKVAAAVGPRISVQWRWTSRRGRPEVGPNYRAPRTYSR
jgi:hypothetical protein